MRDTHRKQVALHMSEEGMRRTERTEPKEKYPQMNVWRAFELFGQVGVSVALPLVIGAMVGAYLDSQWQTRPSATLIGLMIGFIVSIGSFVATIQAFIRKKRR